jgi:hypothetical protein
MISRPLNYLLNNAHVFFKNDDKKQAPMYPVDYFMQICNGYNFPCYIEIYNILQVL